MIELRADIAESINSLKSKERQVPSNKEETQNNQLSGSKPRDKHLRQSRGKISAKILINS